MKKTTLILAAAISLFALTSCSGGNGDAIVGTWTPKTISVDGEEEPHFLIDDDCEPVKFIFNSDKSFDLNSFNIRITEDGTECDPTSEKGEYSTDKDQITIKIGEESRTMAYKIDGNKLTITYSEDMKGDGTKVEIIETYEKL